MESSDEIQQMYRHAWSRFATGVTVITTIEPNGEVHGMTASSVTSVSLDPGLISSTGRFGISILDSSQTDIAKHFATPPESRGHLESGLLGELEQSPVIADAIASMDCSVFSAHPAGDHTVFIGKVEAISVSDGDPLVWFQRQFGVFADGSNG